MSVYTALSFLGDLLSCIMLKVETKREHMKREQELFNIGIVLCKVSLFEYKQLNLLRAVNVLYVMFFFNIRIIILYPSDVRIVIRVIRILELIKSTDNIV